MTLDRVHCQQCPGSQRERNKKKFNKKEETCPMDKDKTYYMFMQHQVKKNQMRHKTTMPTQLTR